MPELVGHVADDLGVVPAGHAAVDLDVGDVGQLGILEPVRPTLELAKPQIERAELPRECDLLMLVQLLVGEDQHRIGVHELLDSADLGGRQRKAEAHTLDTRSQGA